MVPSIFISYRHSDTAGHAGRLFDRLSNWFPKDELFFDVNSVETGDDFPEVIDQAIREAKAILVVIGPDWLDVLNQRVSETSVDFVRREVAIAVQRRVVGDVELLPLLVGGARMPQKERLHAELIDEIGKLLDYQAQTFNASQADWDSQFERLRCRLASVGGVPGPCAQSRLTSGSSTIRFQYVEPTRLPMSLDVSAVEQAFGGISTALLNWPQETVGHWVERPELDQLHDLTTRDESAVTVLLGRPGEGKSAILARLGVKLSKEDSVLLAIKADQLPRKTATTGDLDEWIGCSIPVMEALRKLADKRRVVVLIDQLDALADLMVQHSERLSVLLRLVDGVRGLPNLHVILSCREFEFQNDVRLNTMNAEKVSLARLSWDEVKHVPAARGLETGGWGEDVRDVLRTPQHLAMFLDHLADKGDEPLFTNYQGLLARILEERLEKVHGHRAIEAAECIAADMALEEELWLSRHRFEREFGAEMNHLKTAGFLVSSDNGLSIAFRHQTLFDFLRARSFLRDKQSLAEYIVEKKQESLFIRPILWSALNYLRASDTAIYRKQFDQLWTQKDLRPHLRNLLINFLGNINDPDDQEVQWLFSRREDPFLRPKILSAISSGSGWFARMGSRLPTLMTAEPEEAREVVPLLSKAAEYEPAEVLQLVEKHWVGDERYLTCALSVLRGFKIWDESSVDIIARLADYAPASSFAIQNIADEISISRPDLAPKVIVRYLKARVDKMSTDTALPTGRPPPEDSVTEQIDNKIKYSDVLSAYVRMIDNNSDWYNIDRLAMNAPAAFVREIWPWLVDLFERISQKTHPFLNKYRDHHGSAFKREKDDRHPLQKGIEVAVRGYAESEVEDFLEFVETNKNTDLNVLHRLLDFGLERIAQQHPTAVLEYLLEDPRRFAIGNRNNIHRESQALISAVAPALKDNDALRLERAILIWAYYRIVPKGEDAASHLERRKLAREHRLRLLRAFPFDRLSSSGQMHLREEERAFPSTLTQETHVIGAQWIGSPMSAEQMTRATDDHIFALFEELTDDTGSNHPTRRWPNRVGGSIQASREFANFAKISPDRALNLIRRFQVGTMERPAGVALAELGKGTTPPETLIKTIRELDERGFSSQLFKVDVALCLEQLAPRANGLEDEMCGLLEKWITDWLPEAEGNSTGDGFDHFIVNGNNNEHEEDDKSLLWDDRATRSVPQGNYHLLNTLMCGYLCRKPPGYDHWLAVLERHLKRHENPAVWREVAEDLWRLVGADRQRATTFMEPFICSRPDVLFSVTGTRLIARVYSWLSEELLERFINSWITGSRVHGPQAAGEIMALRLCHNPDSPNIKGQIENILTGADYGPSVVDRLHLGITHTLVAAWGEPALRALTTSLLLRLMSMGSELVMNALSAIFQKCDPLPADDHTHKLLEAMLDRPSILAGGSYFLIEGLKGLLREGGNPNLVHKVANALILEKGKALGDLSTSWALYAGDLVDIALTLHRISETREAGLDLFERLIDVSSYGLDDRIAMIDRPAFQ